MTDDTEKKKRRLKKAMDTDSRLMAHQHCPIDGKAIPMSEEFCSPACQEKYQSMMKKRKFTIMLFYAATIMFIILILISGGST